MFKRFFRLIGASLLGLCLIGGLFLFASNAAPIFAADHYYVDAIYGDNDTGDGSEDWPWQTVSFALSQVVGPDAEIYVAPGIYDETLGESFPIVMEPTIKLIGAGRENTILSGNNSDHVVHFPGTGFYTETTVIRGFKITNGNNGVLVNGRTGTASSPLIEDNWITGNSIGVRNHAVSSQRVSAIIRNNLIDQNNNRGIDLYTGYNGTSLTSFISGNEISDNINQGIYCYSQGSGSSGSSGNSHCNPTISDNLIQNNGSSGFHCNTYYAGECRTLMTNNRFVDNGSWGISRQHAGTYLMTNSPTFINNVFVRNNGGATFHGNDRPTFVNNTIAFNGQYGIRNGLTTVVNSIIWGQVDDLNIAVERVSYSNVGDGEYGGVNNNLSVDPQFSNPARNDLHIIGTSPMIDAGNSAAEDLPDTDMDGDSRVLETAVDIGADETTTAYNVSIHKSVVPTSTVTIDDVFTYTISLINANEASAAGILVTDTLPTNANWDGYVSASTGSVTLENGILNWTGWLPAGIPQTIDFNMRVAPLTAVDSQISNSALIQVPTGPITSSELVTLTVSPGVYWQNSYQRVSHDDALAGQVLTYTIYLNNDGNTTVTDVTVTDTLDSAAIYLTADNGGIPINNQIVWNNLSLATGETLTLTAVVTTTSPVSPNYIATNRVRVAGGGKMFDLPPINTRLFNQVYADFNGTPDYGASPLNVVFNNLSLNATSYVWNYGDGTSSISSGTHSHTYQNSGVYTVSLTAVNRVDSDTATRTEYITVYNLPQANFSAVPRVGTTPLLVEFTNHSIASDEFIWDYGDGITSSVASLTHTHLYASEGVYDISLTAVNPYGEDTFVRNNYVGVYDAPVADFTASITEGVAPLLVYFTNNSTNATMNQWDFGDGQTTVASNPGNIYREPGVYTVTLTVSNPGGSDTLVRTAYIAVYDSPTANFSGAPRIGLAPLRVTFTNFSDRATSYEWDYGDDSMSNNASYTHDHIYDSAGIHTVRLTAMNDYGSDTLTRSSYIQVYDVPTPDFSATPTTGAEPLSVQFTNLSQNATSYYWTFGDGTGSNSSSPSHTYANGGVYTVTLRASNPAASNILTRTNYITVEELPEPAFTASPLSGYLSLTTTFTNTSIYADSYIWDYGDGQTSTTSALVHTHPYSSSGLYDVSLTAVNDFGSRIHTESNYINVSGNPLAGFTAAPTIGPAPLGVSFSNQSQHATDYLWTFGDGSVSTQVNPHHAYNLSGIYTVTLTASNAYASHTITQTEYITAYDQPVAALQAVPRIGEAPLVVTFTNESQYAHSLVWDYGDGSTQSITDSQHTHTYTMPGVYTVTLTAINPNGTHTISHTHYIAVMAPTSQPKYYVDALYGRDDVGDGSINNPWQSISFALSQVDQQDVTIYVATGLYDSVLGESFPIVMEPGVHLIGGHRTATIISGPGTGNVIHFTNAIAYPETSLIQGFKITGGSNGIRIDGATTVDQTPRIDGNWITGNTDGILTYVRGSTRYVYAIISHNLISNNARYGIYNDADSGNQTGQAHTKPSIVNNEISNNGSDGIYCDAYGFSSLDRGSCLAQITGNQITENGGSGVRASAGYAGLNNIVLRENIISHNQGWGVKRTEGPSEYWTVTRPKLYNNLIYNNNQGGLNIHKEDEAVLVNNTIANNSTYGIKRENSGERAGYVYVINSIVWGHNDNLNNIIVDWVSYSDLGDGEYSGTNNNVSVDPLFVNPQQFDFHLGKGSPVIDLGDKTVDDLPVIDFEGDPRVWTSEVDMGADEVVDGRLIDITITAVPDIVAAGQPISYTIVVTSLSQMTITIDLINTFPVQVIPSGEITRSLVFSTYQQVWSETVSVTTQADYAGLLINTLEAAFYGTILDTQVVTTSAEIPIIGLLVQSDSPTIVGQPTTVTATVSAGYPVSYTWDLGDGNFDEGAIIHHVFEAPGVYTATVTARNFVSNQVVSIPITVEVKEFKQFIPIILRE